MFELQSSKCQFHTNLSLMFLIVSNRIMLDRISNTNYCQCPANFQTSDSKLKRNCSYVFGWAATHSLVISMWQMSSWSGRTQISSYIMSKSSLVSLVHIYILCQIFLNPYDCARNCRITFSAFSQKQISSNVGHLLPWRNLELWVCRAT